MTCFALAGREGPHMALTIWDSSSAHVEPIALKHICTLSICAPDVYVSSNVRTLLKEPQYCIMYASGQQPGRAGGPGKSPGPPNGSPKGERTTGRGMSAG